MSEGVGRGPARGLSPVLLPGFLTEAKWHVHRCNSLQQGNGDSSFQVRSGYRSKCSFNGLRIHGSWDAGFLEGVAKALVIISLVPTAGGFLSVYDLVLLCCEEEAAFSWHGPGARP